MTIELGEQMAEILAEFTLESREHIDQLEDAMLSLERDPSEEAAMAAAFRALHSIKGNASLLALEPFEALTHAGETVLGRVRSAELDLEGPVVDALLGLVDLLRRMVDRLAALEPGASFEAPEVGPALRSLAPWLGGGQQPGQGGPEPGQELLALAEHEGEGELATAASKIRVDVALLDRLMNLVGELVLARNQILQHASEGQLSAVLATAQRLDQVTMALQDAAMKTRMQPVGTIWTRFPRVVRDLCHELGKRARVEIFGRETELDKQIVEALHDPLTHLLRNAVDHGIETPERRAAAGKGREGTIRIRGFHEGGLVNLEISDDGAGVDPAKIRRRAAKLGWSAEALDALDERALHELLFVPGFSTRSEAGKLSGRGVGLDVVRTNIERLGGTIELHSRLGRGTTVRVKIPLTLAIVPALIVTCAGQRFAIPQVNLIEIVRVPAAARRERFATIHGAAVLRLRGHLLPMTALARALALGEGRGGPSEAELTGEGASEGEPRDATVVVLQADEQRYGLLVEAVHDTEEIVVKPLWSVLDELGCYAGATVLGDGAVALILDSVGLAARAGLLDEVLAGEQEQAQRELVEEPARRRGNATAGPQRQYLLCRSAGAERLAIPLAEVSRLEEIHASRVERMGPQEVIQHNEEIVPLVRLSRLLGGELGAGARAEAPGEIGGELDRLQLVIHRVDGRPAGIIVDELLDIIESGAPVQRPAARPGVLGSLVIDGQVTELLDVEGALRLGTSSFSKEHTR